MKKICKRVVVEVVVVVLDLIVVVVLIEVVILIWLIFQLTTCHYLDMIRSERYIDK